ELYDEFRYASLGQLSAVSAFCAALRSLQLTGDQDACRLQDQHQGTETVQPCVYPAYEQFPHRDLPDIASARELAPRFHSNMLFYLSLLVPRYYAVLTIIFLNYHQLMLI